jgi:hypothetical protein
VYVRQPAGLDLAEQPFPLVIELARRFTAGRERELRAGLEPEQAALVFLSSLFGLVASMPASAAERRGDMLLLASLFLADDAALPAGEPR